MKALIFTVTLLAGLFAQADYPLICEINANGIIDLQISAGGESEDDQVGTKVVVNWEEGQTTTHFFSRNFEARRRREISLWVRNPWGDVTQLKVISGWGTEVTWGSFDDFVENRFPVTCNW